MNISDILESVKNGKLSTEEAKKQLSLYTIEEIENFAKIDLGREARKGIPEVIFAERKENSEVKKIIKKVLEKTNAIVVSRIPKKNYQDICNYCKENNLVIIPPKIITFAAVKINILLLTIFLFFVEPPSPLLIIF